MPIDLTAYKATSHHMSLCWPKLMLQNGVTLALGFDFVAAILSGSYNLNRMASKHSWGATFNGDDGHGHVCGPFY